MDTINRQNLAKMAHDIAVEQGKWKHHHSNEHSLMVVMKGINDVLDAFRTGKQADLKTYRDALPGDIRIGGDWRDYVGETELYERHIAGTIEDELAEIAIRLYDIAGCIGLIFDKYNPIRYRRIFENFDDLENAFALVKALANESYNIERRILFGLQYVYMWASSMYIQLDTFVRMRIAYHAAKNDTARWNGNI